MARTPEPIRRLTAAQLGIETNLADDEQEIVSKNEISAPNATTSAQRIPKQVDAPIITAITDYKLVEEPGRIIEQTASKTEMGRYLAGQFRIIISDLEGNTDRRTVAAFREAETFLQNWTIDKLLAFGAHLYLLESHIGPLKQELMDAPARQLEAAVFKSRRFINSFEEWHEYVKQSVLLDIEAGDGAKEITSVAKEASEKLAQEYESVEQHIPDILSEYVNTANRKENNQGVAVAVMSALRSLTNIAVSITEYVTQAAKTTYAYLKRNERPMKLVRLICRLVPVVARLAVSQIEFSWFLNFSDYFRALCDLLAREERAK